MADSTASTLIFLLAAVTAGRAIAQWVKTRLTPNQARHLRYFANAMSVGCVVAMMVMIRPSLPKEGAWEVVHTSEELRHYHEALVLAETVEHILSDMRAENAFPYITEKELHNKESSVSFSGNLTVAKQDDDSLLFSLTDNDGTRSNFSVNTEDDPAKSKLTAEYLAGEELPRDTIL